MKDCLSEVEARHQLEEVRHHIDTLRDRLTKDCLTFVDQPTKNRRGAHPKSIGKRLDLLSDLLERREQLREQLSSSLRPIPMLQLAGEATAQAT
jgi:hypothetical protein